MMASRTILITGGGRGLGSATAEALAAIDGLDVIVTARTNLQCEAIVARFKYKGLKVRAFPLQLDDFKSVRDFPTVLLHSGIDKLDVLVLSAAVMQQSPTRRTTCDGLEETIQVNVLSQMLLIELLLDFLLKTSQPRIVTLTSRLHFPGSRGIPVNFDINDPCLEKPDAYHYDRAYKNTKLAVLWMTYEFQERFSFLGYNIKINSFCPGFVPDTAVHSSQSWVTWFLLRFILPYMPFATSVDQAMEKYKFMILDTSFDKRPGGGFFTEGEEHKSSPDSYDIVKRRKFCIWALTQYQEFLGERSILLGSDEE